VKSHSTIKSRRTQWVSISNYRESCAKGQCAIISNFVATNVEAGENMVVLMLKV
jgi:hypothetical protein